MESFFLFQLNYDFAALLIRWLVVFTLIPFGIKKFVSRKTMSAEFPAVMGLSHKLSFYMALFAETVAPACLFIGFFTRIAALGGILNMGVAYRVFSKTEKFKETPYYYAPSFPILLGYCIVFLLGPGNWSLDAFIF